MYKLFKTPELNYTHTSKILTKIINQSIKRKVKNYLNNGQYGFRKQKGTIEHIMSLNTYFGHLQNVCL